VAATALRSTGWNEARGPIAYIGLSLGRQSGRMRRELAGEEKVMLPNMKDNSSDALSDA
jgi:hypothetical protein